MNKKQREKQLQYKKQAYIQAMLKKAPAPAEKCLQVSEELMQAYRSRTNERDFQMKREEIIINSNVDKIQLNILKTDENEMNEIRNTLRNMEHEMMLLKADFLIYRIENS